MSAAGLNQRTLSHALYVVAAMLIVIPLSDALPVLWPLRAGTTEWRFGVVGILSGALTLPLLGAFLVLAAAGLLGHRQVLAVAAWLAFVLAAVLVLAAGLFAMDFIEVRARLRPEARPLMLGAAEKAAFKLALGAIVAVVLGFSARRIARRLRQEAAEQQPAVLVRAEHG